MSTIHAFIDPVNDITAFRATHANKLSLFISHAEIYNTLTCFRIAIIVQITNNLLFKIILISWIYNTCIIFTFKINIDIVPAWRYRRCLAPINLNFAAVSFILIFQNGIAQFLKDRNVNAKRIP